jgi:hypothetical protein
MRLMLLIIVILISPISGTIRKCEKDQDCLMDDPENWCNSGFICLENNCRKIPGHPCLHTQKCSNEEKKCINISCKKDQDCNDGLFCNGREYCDKKEKICKPGNDNCDSGICSEEDMTCSWPIKLWKWKHKHKSASSKFKSEEFHKFPNKNNRAYASYSTKDKNENVRSSSFRLEEEDDHNEMDFEIETSNDTGIFDPNSTAFQLSYIILSILFGVCIISIFIFLLFRKPTLYIDNTRSRNDVMV